MMMLFKVKQEIKDDEEEEETSNISWVKANECLNTFIEFAESSPHYTFSEVMNLHMIKSNFVKKLQDSISQETMEKTAGNFELRENNFADERRVQQTHKPNSAAADRVESYHLQNQFSMAVDGSDGDIDDYSVYIQEEDIKPPCQLLTNSSSPSCNNTNNNNNITNNITNKSGHLIKAKEGTLPPCLFRCEFCGEQFVDNRFLERHRHGEHGNHIATVAAAVAAATASSHVNRQHQNIGNNVVDGRGSVGIGIGSGMEIEIRIDDDSSHSSGSSGGSDASTGGKLYHCDTCGKLFTDPALLLLHRRSHDGIKMFQCDICYKHFTERSHMQRHKRTHTGERPFGCDTCGKHFARSDKLIRHKRIHTGEKPYQCDLCGKEFGRSDKLLQHRRTHLNLGHYATTPPSLKPTPLKTTPLKTTPLKTTPLKTTPLKTTPLNITPLNTTPLNTTPHTS